MLVRTSSGSSVKVDFMVGFMVDERRSVDFADSQILLNDMLPGVSNIVQ